MEATTIVITVVIALVALAVGAAAGFFWRFQLPQKDRRGPDRQCRGRGNPAGERGDQDRHPEKERSHSRSQGRSVPHEGGRGRPEGRGRPGDQAARAEIKAGRRTGSTRRKPLWTKRPRPWKSGKKRSRSGWPRPRHTWPRLDQLRAKQMERLETLAGLSQPTPGKCC